jgi:membrane protease YdiL (CAAX protease family)
MIRVSIIVVYFCTICLLGCLLAYPIYQISGANFERIVSRTILILAILLFYPTCRILKINDFTSLGFNRENFFPIAIRSWLLGAVMLAPISIFFLSCGFRLWEPAPQNLIEPVTIIFSAIISACIIGLIEETLFRGLLQSQLTSAMNSFWAVIVVSIIYSGVHFLQAPGYDPNQTVHWYSGFTLLSSAFANFNNASTFLDAWVALFLAGLFLSLVRLRTNNILWCIGIHAGWVTHIKVFKDVTDRDNTAQCGSFASNYDNFIGEFSAAWILLILLAWSFMRHRKSLTG